MNFNEIYDNKSAGPKLKIEINRYFQELLLTYKLRNLPRVT